MFFTAVELMYLSPWQTAASSHTDFRNATAGIVGHIMIYVLRARVKPEAGVSQRNML